MSALDDVCAEVAALLRLGSASEVDPNRSFKDLGLTSMQGGRLRLRLQKRTGVSLSPTAAFEYPTPRKLARHIEDPDGADEDEAIVAPPPTAATGSADPVAIVGVGCRFPGGVVSGEGLWELVAGGVDAIAGFPEDRGWDLEALFDPDPDRVGTSYVRDGGFLDDVGAFDAGLFGISPREALAMDPQQRLVLEVVWEALERAGIDPRSLAGERAGVFVGAYSSGYLVGSELEGHRLTGLAQSVISGRVAYTLGLEGPAVSLDTACSSSLVAMHMACGSLRAGECSLALAGGVTVMASPDTFVMFARQRGLAPNGRCKAFAAAADGTGWGEGVGIVVLERLEDARANGREILGLIRGSAVNQDGASNGLSAPNGRAQERVIRQALANAGLSAGDVDVVEAHGTGTALGDPIEAGALLATYGQGRGQRDPLWLGSLKSNIGHTQAAAGAGGVIKMLEAMRHGRMPQTLHVDAPSHAVDWASGAVQVLQEARPWERNGEPRRAGVSSFGISGTNAHVILEEAPADQPVREPAATAGAAPAQAGASGDPGLFAAAGIPWLISAASDDGVRAQAQRLLEHVERHPDLRPADVGYSLATTRAQLAQRAAIAAPDRDTILDALRALAAGDPHPNVARGRVIPSVAGRTVWVFPGQGSQWVGMGVRLLDTSAGFARLMTDCDRAIAAYAGWSVIDVLRGAPGAPPITRVDVVQPVLFAMMVCVAGLWRSLGAQPTAVMGHSQGEIAAAYVAGALSLDDAARIIVERGLTLRALGGLGGMLAVPLAQDRVMADLAGVDGVSVAAINGPRSLVLSGDPDALERLRAHWDAQGVDAKLIAVDYAAHSTQIEPLREQFLERLAGIAPQPIGVAFYSTVECEILAGKALDAEYWYRNLRQTVQFDRCTRVALTDGHRAFVEMSPHTVLTFPLEQTHDDLLGPDDEMVVVGSLRRHEDDARQFVRAMADGWVRGVGVDWAGVLRGVDARRVGLPTYAFERERFWSESVATGGDVRGVGLVAGEHRWLGAVVELPDGGLVLSGRLDLGSDAWLADHVVLGVVVVPETAFVELVWAAAGQAGCGCVEEMVVGAPLVLSGDGGTVLRVTVSAPDRAGTRSVGVFSRGEGDDGADWVAHATATVGVGAVAAGSSNGVAGQWPPAGAAAVEIDDLYLRLSELGHGYGPVFQGLTGLWRRGEEVFVEAQLGRDEPAADGGFAVHPALLDSVLHATLGDAVPGPRVAATWSGIRWLSGGMSGVRACVRATGPDTVSVVVGDGAGGVVGTIDAVTVRRLDPAQLAAGGARDALFAVEWVEVGGEPVPVAGPVVVLGPADGALGGLGLPGYEDLAGLQAAVAAGSAVPSVVLVDLAAAPAADRLALRTGAVQHALALVQAWVRDPALVQSRLVLVTAGAQAAGASAVSDLAGAGVWGLVRSAQVEYPGCFGLVDIDDDPRSLGSLLAALAPAPEEPQLAIRAGQVLAARLAPAAAGTAPVLDRNGTVLVTGGAGALGSLLARHLVSGHGVRHVMLVSRPGADARGASELADELRGLGAQVSLVACDIADRDQLAGALAQIPAEHPLKAVIHADRVLDDGVIEQLTPDRIDAVLAPQAHAAWQLHELTEHLELDAFVLVSSIAGTLGSAGQANYAAASAAVDALAHYRAAHDLPAVAIAWGHWEPDAGAVLAGEDDVARAYTHLGIAGLSHERGLALFDAALATQHAHAVVLPLDRATLNTRARAGTLPALLRGLVRIPPRAAKDTHATLAGRLKTTPEDERDQLIRDTVLEQLAATLGHQTPAKIDPGRAFKDLGIDSLGAVGLRNRLNDHTGLRLPASLIFDHPTPNAVIAFVTQQAVEVELQTSSQPGATLSDVLPKVGDASGYADFMTFLTSAARLRSNFASPAPEDVPEAHRIATGDPDRKVICIGSIAPWSGPLEYLKLAAHFEGRHEVWAVTLPGFAAGTRVPRDVQAVSQALAAAVTRCADGTSFTLVGRSSGGVFGLSAAGELHEAGVSPEAVVLIDSYQFDQLDERALQTMWQQFFFPAVLARERVAGALDLADLSSLGAYLPLCEQWRTPPLVAPTLLVRASESPEVSVDGNGNRRRWEASWTLDLETIDVAGNHWSMLEDHAATTAGAVMAWLETAQRAPC